MASRKKNSQQQRPHIPFKEALKRMLRASPNRQRAKKIARVK
jgi:hypothetical protein